MKIAIGNVTSDANTINKTFNALLYFSDVKIKDSMEIVNPTFIINTPVDINVNYCYCEELGRFYYIDEKTVMTGGRTSIDCRVDVLKTYASDILNLNVIIDKQQQGSKANLYLDDGSLVTENRTSIDTIEFSNGFNNNGEYILVVAGG